MKRITALLEGLELANAEATQQAVLDELEELKRLLLTADLDLELKLRELDAFEAALQRLGALETQERNQRDQTGELNDKDAGQAKRLAELLEADERRNQRAAEDLAQSLQQLGGEGAKPGEAVADAGKEMGEAAQQSGSTRPRTRPRPNRTRRLSVLPRPASSCSSGRRPSNRRSSSLRGGV